MHDIELHVTLCNFLLFRHQVAYIVSILQLVHETIQLEIQTQVFGGKYVRCVRLPCKFHTSLYVLTQFPPIQTVMGSTMWKTPCKLFMLMGVAHKIPNHVCGGINKRCGGFNNSQ